MCTRDQVTTRSTRTTSFNQAKSSNAGQDGMSSLRTTTSQALSTRVVRKCASNTRVDAPDLEPSLLSQRADSSADSGMHSATAEPRAHIPRNTQPDGRDADGDLSSDGSGGHKPEGQHVRGMGAGKSDPEP